MNKPDDTAPHDTASLDTLFRQFEERYQGETSEVRALSCKMQDVMGVTEAVLVELDNRPWWKRVWHRLSGRTHQLERLNYRNQLKLQQSSLLLITAIARQNRMIMDGLRLTLDKLERVENDARYLREAVMRAEDRRLRRAARWAPVVAPFKRCWAWLRAQVHSH
ncbi:hypothetical protein GX586_15115 [bacterium]|nr:hypothetical protein [bacterium]